MEDLNFISFKEMEDLRKTHHEKQGGICAATGIICDYVNCVIDHRHKTKSESLGGPEGLGLIRGVIDRNVNTFEGKIFRAWKRYGLHNKIDLPSLLRMLAEYIESPPMFDLKIVHPTERPKAERLSKLEYNRVRKYWFCMYPHRKVLPPYPAKGVKSNKWKDYIKRATALDELNKKGELRKEVQMLIERSKIAEVGSDRSLRNRGDKKPTAIPVKPPKSHAASSQPGDLRNKSGESIPAKADRPVEAMTSIPTTPIETLNQIYKESGETPVTRTILRQPIVRTQPDTNDLPRAIPRIQNTNGVQRVVTENTVSRVTIERIK